MNQSRPVEANYIPQARIAITAKLAREFAANQEIEAKRAAAKSMHNVRVREFDFDTPDGRWKAKLKRPMGKRVSVEKLYTLVREGRISLSDFLECVSANQELVSQLVGEEQVPSLMEEYRKGLDLVITRKG
jgi:hypothetical protein